VYQVLDVRVLSTVSSGSNCRVLHCNTTLVIFFHLDYLQLHLHLFVVTGDVPLNTNQTKQ